LSDLPVLPVHSLIEPALKYGDQSGFQAGKWSLRYIRLRTLF
jgi:hypothetical protein